MCAAIEQGCKRVHSEAVRVSGRRENARFHLAGCCGFLLFAWIGSFIVYHVAGFLIHLLLIFAVIALVIQLFTGRRVT
jgi:Flp pilus assembly protein TadB